MCEDRNVLLSYEGMCYETSCCCCFLRHSIPLLGACMLVIFLSSFCSEHACLYVSHDMTCFFLLLFSSPLCLGLYLIKGGALVEKLIQVLIYKQKNSSQVRDYI